MSNYQRLQRAFARDGIALVYRDGVYHLHNDAVQARVLLPAALPLERKAVRQLLDFAAVRSPNGCGGVCQACATPDFHPGSIAPIGSIVATDIDFVIPAAIGTDINCGMRLLTTGLTWGQAAPHKDALIRGLTRSLLDNGRDVPVSTAAFRAHFDVGPEAFSRTGSMTWCCAFQFARRVHQRAIDGASMRGPREGPGRGLSQDMGSTRRCRLFLLRK